MIVYRTDEDRGITPVTAKLRVMDEGTLALTLNGVCVLFLYPCGRVLRALGAGEVAQYGLKVDASGKLVIG